MPWYEYSRHGADPPLPLVEIQLRLGDRGIRLVALLDSGADVSLLDIRHAEALGLDRRNAVSEESVGADGSTFATYLWPDAQFLIEFEGERVPFRGSFTEFPPGSDTDNLLGRGDFFRRFIVQLWDAAGPMNIDLSPDFPARRWAPHLLTRPRWRVSPAD
jgi:hypothetical protein